eukprot:5833863-Prymnesium_polylepis.2
MRSGLRTRAICRLKMGAHKRRTLELPLCGGGAAAEAPVAPILMASSLHHLSGKVPPPRV